MQPAQRIYQLCATVCAALAVVPGYYALTLRWAPHADFDVTGLLWILQNFPRLLAYFLTLALVVRPSTSSYGRLRTSKLPLRPAKGTGPPGD